MRFFGHEVEYRFARVVGEADVDQFHLQIALADSLDAHALRFLLAVAVFILLTQIAFVGDAQHRFEQREVQSRGR